MPCKTIITGTICILLLSATKHSHAQSDTIVMQVSSVNSDSIYIGDYTNLLTTRLFLLYENASLLVNPTENVSSTINYRPNINVRIGLAGFWKWFGMGLSIDNPVYKTDQVAYGKTSTLDLRVNAFGREVAGELYMQNFKGFYILSPERLSGPHYLIPDMQIFSFGLDAYWIYNSKRFSIRAAFIQNERQIKSAGSFVLMPSFIYYRVSSKQGIIPQEIVESYHIPVTNLVTSARVYSLGLSPGYAYTLVFLKNFYLTAALFPGAAAQFASYSNDHNSYSDIEINFQLTGRFAIGYNSEKWFLGGSFQTGFNGIPNQLSHALFSYELAQFRLWGGLRFDVFRKKRK